MGKNEVVKRVRAALEREPAINLHRHPLGVNVVDNLLLVQGEVEDIAAKRLALQIARTAPGIRDVVDRVRVAVPQRRGDGAIRRSLCESMLGERELATSTIRANVKGRTQTLRDAGADRSGEIIVTVDDDGVVTLDGSALSLSHKRLAGVLAWWTPGCRDVINALEIVPPEDDNDDEVVDALRLVFEIDPLVDSDRFVVRCRDRAVTLEGTARSKEERRRAEFDAWALDAVNGVTNRIDVNPLA